MNNEIIIQKIIQKYGNLDSKRGRDAIGIIFGVHSKTIEMEASKKNVKLTYNTANVKRLETAIDPYEVLSSATTQLSFSASETPQNQTRDTTKILKKKLPANIGNDELSFPSDKTLYTSPLTNVAETALQISLGTIITKSVGVQYSFSRSNPISAGCICVLGDTKLLEDENTAASLFMVLNDTLTMVVAKWKATMTPAVAYAGFTQSYVHSALSFEIPTGKYVASFIASADYGMFNNGIYYEVDRYSGSNASKNNLGLNVGTTINPFWNLNMTARPFPNVAQGAYIRGGIVVDASKRDTEIVRNLEGASGINFYSQIYKPTLRVCGGSLVHSAYSGTVSPISRLAVLSNKTRTLTLLAFSEKRLPTVVGHDSYFSGNIIGRAQNGNPYNIIDSVTLLEDDLVNSKDIVNILSCTATADSWLVTTDNQFGPVQVVATPAYNPMSITALNKASPAFTNTTSIASSDDWQVSVGWRVTSNLIYQNSTSFTTYNAFDRYNNTYWASAKNSFSSSGIGSQWVQIGYPEEVKMTSYRINP
ncbi:hypothetical protein T492DRAFT_1127164 [Pavlovales sp. CCMP2436]|nr:hypothetical protein T492DRAFT_1127164 [Pavlovales sp. CCMP2436]